MPTAADRAAAGSRRIALVSCVKTKRPDAAPAQDLYISHLFTGLRRYAERNAAAWYILSAEHGLLEPGRVIAPYERTLNNMPKAARADWARRVQQDLVHVLPAGCEVLLLAGQRYREGCETFLRDRGHLVTIPLEGLSFGRQLQWLAARDREQTAPGS